MIQRCLCNGPHGILLKMLKLGESKLSACTAANYRQSSARLQLKPYKLWAAEPLEYCFVMVLLKWSDVCSAMLPELSRGIAWKLPFMRPKSSKLGVRPQFAVKIFPWSLLSWNGCSDLHFLMGMLT